LLWGQKRDQGQKPGEGLGECGAPETIYTVFQKKEATKLLAVTLSNVNRF